jgi:putative heme degradation protein
MKKSKEEELFDKWLELREQHGKAKREKDYTAIIEVSEKIITHSKQAPDIRIMDAVFERDIADAYIKMGNVPSAVTFYKRAVKSFETYRATNKLRDPGDFLSEIEKIQKKLLKLEQ